MSKKSQLDRTLEFMSDGEFHTSLEIAKVINPSGLALAVGSTIADLRKKGHKFDSEYFGKTKDGNTIWRYRLIIKTGQLDLGMKGIYEERHG